MKNKDVLNVIGSNLLLVAAVLFPVWFLPITINPFGFQKQYLLVILAALMAGLWVVQTIRNRRVLLSFSTLNVTGLAAATITAISAAIVPNVPYQLSGRFVTLAAFAVVLLFGASVARKVTWNQLLKIWLYAASALSVLTLLQLTPVNPATMINSALGTSFPTTLLFNLAESPLVYLTFAVPVALAGLAAVFQRPAKAAQTPVARLLTGPLPWSILTLASSAVVGVVIMADENLRPVLLPFRYGWSIAVESFKQLPTFLVGFGPENFISAFHRFRDVSYNVTPLWEVRFNVSTSEFLHSLTVTGVLGLGTLLLFLASLLIAGRHQFKAQPSLLVFVLAQVVLFFTLPFNALTWAILAILGVTIMSEMRQRGADSIKDVVVMLSAIRIVPEGNLKTVRTTAGFAYVIAIVVLLLGAAGVYGAGRIYASQVMYYLSLQAATKNDAVKTYEQQQWAIRLHPYDPALRRAYASTNLAIAQSLSQKGEELTDQERQTLSELLQQAVREARNSAALNPSQTENWEIVATVYSQLLEVEGAAQWVNAALVQAVQTDPIAPGLRIALAGLYRQDNQPVQAQRLIEQAIELKPDWANGYYNYGDLLEEQGQSILAYQGFQRTLQLLPADSQDTQIVQDRLDSLKPKAEADLKALQEQQAQAQAAQQQGQAGQEGQGNQQIPNPSNPTVPDEQPAVENPPDGFQEIVNNEQPAEQPEQEQPANDENIVLPEDVGF
jgi:tetratricopeptide (TPR) repeat protein